MKQTYNVRDKEIYFENLTVAEATRIQTAMTILSGATKQDFDTMAQAQDAINKLALKKAILKAENSEQQDCKIVSLETIFGDELVIMEISALFLKELMGFFQSSKVLNLPKA